MSVPPRNVENTKPEPLGLSFATNASVASNVPTLSVRSNAPLVVGKFREVVEPAIGKSVPLPRPLQEALGRPRHSVSMDVDYPTLREFLLR